MNPKICNITPEEYQAELITLSDLDNPKKEVLIFLSGLIEEVGELVEVVLANIEFDLEDEIQVSLLRELEEFGYIAKSLSKLKRIFRGDNQDIGMHIIHEVLTILPMTSETKLVYTKESGDAQAYKTLLDYCFGVNLEDVLLINKAKLKGRKEKGTLKGKGNDR